MAKQYPADTVGKNGNVFPTVGENIRNAVNADSMLEETDKNRGRFAGSLHMSAASLKTAIISTFTGRDRIYYGGTTTEKLTDEEINAIKEFLGISQAKE